MNLQQHRERVDQASRTLAEGRKALLRPDGSKRYSDVEHAEREATLLTQFSTTIREAGDAAQAAIRDAEATLDRAPSDPLHTLGREDLERAKSLAHFVEQDVETLPLVEVARRAEAALEQDKPTRYLWWRYGSRKAREVRDAARSRSLRLDSTENRALVTLETLVGRLEATLVDVQQRERARQAAEEQRRAASSVISRAAVDSYIVRTYGTRPAAATEGQR